jgi:hypothetical protein
MNNGMNNDNGETIFVEVSTTPGISPIRNEVT